MTHDNCTRKMITIHGEPYYLVAGEGFIHVTCPRENDPHMSRERETIEIVCQEYNELMETLTCERRETGLGVASSDAIISEESYGIKIAGSANDVSTD